LSILTHIRAYQRALLENPRRKSALYDLHPELRDRVHVYSGFADRLSQTADDYVGHATTFISYVWVRKAVTLIAQTLAPLPIRVVDSAGKALNSHPLVRLYADPNDTMPGPEFRGVSLIHLLLGGERATEIVDDTRGQPRELWPRRPDRVGIRPDETRKGYPRAAEYVLSDLATPSYDGTVPVEAVIFEKFTNPLSDWRGLSPISAVMQGIQIALLAQAQRKLFYRNNARVEYALTAAESLAPDERARLEAQVAEKYGGGQGTGKPMILEFGQDIKSISYPPKDMTSLEDQGLTADEVAAIFGIPDILMGFGADTYDTQEKRDAAMSVLWALTLLPLVQQFDQTETHFWTNTRPMLRGGERIQTDLSSVAILQEDVLPKLEGATKLFALGVPMKVINDRLKLGLGEFPGNAVGYLPMNLVPADELSTPAPVASSGDQQASATPNAPILGYHIESGVVSRNEARAQLGLAPEDESTDEKLRRLQGQLTVALAAVNVGIDTNQALALVGIDLTVETPEVQLAIRRALETKRRRPSAARIGASLQRIRFQVARRMEPKVDDYFAQLAKDVVARARASGKAIKAALPSVDDLIEAGDAEGLSRLFRSFTITLLEASWETWNTALDLDIAFEQSDPAVVSALKQSGSRITDILDTTRDKVRNLLEYGAEQGWTIAELIRGDETHPGLRDVVTETYKGRAKAIARTELGTAQAVATVSRYKDAGVKRVIIFDGGGDDSDDVCTQLNNTSQTLAWYEKNPLEHPNCVRAAGPDFD
jgi:HK97 family phage portal protein